MVGGDSCRLCGGPGPRVLDADDDDGDVDDDDEDAADGDEEGADANRFASTRMFPTVLECC